MIITWRGGPPWVSLVDGGRLLLCCFLGRPVLLLALPLLLHPLALDHAARGCGGRNGHLDIAWR
jgi:hypothetical protein